MAYRNTPGADDVAAVSLHFERGNALFALRHYRDASAAYREAWRLDPESGDVLLNLGAALANQGLYSEAIEVLEKAILYKSGRAEIYHQLALCYMYDKKLNAALRSLRLARDLDVDNPKTYVLLSQVHKKRGDLDAFKKALEAACKLGSRVSCR